MYFLGAAQFLWVPPRLCSFLAVQLFAMIDNFRLACFY